MTDTLYPISKDDEHSDIVGGSSADRVINCPASVSLNQKVKKAHKQNILAQLIANCGLSPALDLDTLPVKVRAQVDALYRDETTSIYAAEGTGLHEAMAWLLENDEEGVSVVDRTFEDVLITEELYSSAIEPALRTFEDFLDKVFEEDGEEMEFAIEKRCQMPGLKGVFGTTDIVGKTSKRIVIWDWKFGEGKLVSPFENNQLRFYGRAAVHTMFDWFGFPEDPDKKGQFHPDLRVDLVISQPRIGTGEPQIWTTNYSDLEKFRGTLIRAVSEATSEDPACDSGNHCFFCEAKHVCPIKRHVAEKIQARLDEALNVADPEDKGMSVADALNAHEVAFTPNDLAQWYEEALEIADYVKHIKALAYSELKAGRAVTDRKLIQGLGNAAWTVDDKTVDRRLGAYGIDVKTRRQIKAISPTTARQLLKGDEKHSALIEKIIERPKGTLKMVHVDAAGDPVVPLSDKMAEVGELLRDKILTD